MTYEMRTDTITFEAALRDIESKNQSARTVAADALGGVVDADERKRANAALIAALGDPVAAVRAEAALSLGDLESEAAVEPLSVCIEDDTPLVRQSAVIALGRLGFASSFDIVAACLSSGAPDTRFEAATALVEIDPERASPHLTRALGDDDSEVVAAAAIGLGAIGDTSAIDALLGALATWSDNARTRFDIGYALSQLGDGRAVAVLSDYVDHKDLAWDAIEALHKLGDIRGADALAPLLARRLLALPVRLRAAAAILGLLSAADQTDERATRRDSTQAAWRCLRGGLTARKLDHRGLAVHLLGDVGDSSVLDDLRALQKRRGGRKLLEEIDEAIASIQARGTPNEPG